MALTARITKEQFDGLDELLQAEYKQDDDGFILDVIAADGLQLANVTELQSALQTERSNAKSAKATLKKFHGSDGKLLDPAKVHDALAKMSEIDAWDPEDKLREHKEQFEAQTREKLEKEKQQLIEKHDSDMKELQNENGTLADQLDLTLRKNTAITAINSHGGSVRGLLPVVMSMTRVVRQDDGKRIVEVIGDNGLARLSPTSGKTGLMEIDELVVEIKADKELGKLFKASGASGSGATPGDTGGGSGGGGVTGNPFLDASWSLTAQAQLQKSDSGEARRLQKEAISKEPEGRAARMQTMPSAGMAGATS